MDVTLPDGTTVNGVPDGTSKAQLAEKLRANGRNVPQEWLAPPPPKQQDNLLDKARYGVEAVTEPVISAASAIPATIAGGVAGAAETLTSGKFGTQEGIAAGQKRAGEVADKFTYQPRNPAARNAMEYVQKLIEKSKLQGLNPATAVEAAPAARAAGAYGKAAVGDATRVGSEAVGGALDKAVTAGMTPEKRALAEKALALDINLRPDMLSDNKIMRMVGEALEKVPLSGSKAEQRQVAFNRALGAMIGANKGASRLTPDVFDRAITKSGAKIGEISGKAPVTLDAQALERHVHDTAGFETADVAKIVKSYVTEIQEKAQGGTIDGTAFRKINSKLGRQIRTTNNGDLKNALGELQETLHDALTASRTGAELEALQEARRQYAIAKTIAPLVAKSATGNISPRGLMGAVTSDKAKKDLMARGKSGDLGDLARIGQAFLKEPDSSGTTERNLAYGLISDSARLARDAAVYPMANIYNRAGPAAVRRALRVKDMPKEMRDTPIGDLGNE